MANKKKKKAPSGKSAGKARAPEERLDRRFTPAATTSPLLLYGLLITGALCIGLGVYAQFLRPEWSKLDPAPWAFWPLSGGGFLVAAAVWFSSNGDAALRVGSPGVAEERNGVRRIPWHSLSSVRFVEDRGHLLVEGADESGSSVAFAIKVRAHRAAAAHLLAEALERVPDVVDVPESVQKDIGPADPNAGLRLKEPLQVVGKRCAASGKVIAYEPDARVCPQCERVYHKRHVPKQCACGADLTALQDGMLPKDLAEASEDAAPSNEASA